MMCFMLTRTVRSKMLLALTPAKFIGFITKFIGFITNFLVFITQFLVFNTQFLVLNTQFLVLNTQFLVFKSKIPLVEIQNSRLLLTAAELFDRNPHPLCEQPGGYVAHGAGRDRERQGGAAATPRNMLRNIPGDRAVAGIACVLT